jgi:hypothetical protein
MLWVAYLHLLSNMTTKMVRYFESAIIIFVQFRPILASFLYFVLNFVMAFFTKYDYRPSIFFLCGKTVNFRLFSVYIVYLCFSAVLGHTACSAS